MLRKMNIVTYKCSGINIYSLITFHCPCYFEPSLLFLSARIYPPFFSSSRSFILTIEMCARR